MSEHTPGSWVAEDKIDDRCGWREPRQQILITGPKGELIANYTTEFMEYPDDDVNAANARLIAAAPDMLDVHTENARILRYLVNELQGRIEDGKLAALHGCLDRCDAAIAKATGGQ